MPDPVSQRPTAPQLPAEYVRAFELVNELWNDGTAGPVIRGKAKEKYNIRLPEDTTDQIVAPLKAELADLQKTIKEEREARAKEKATAEENRSKTTLEDAISAARKNYNLTDEGFDKMVSRMKETGNFADADAAAAWVISKEPPPKAPGPSWAPQKLDLQGNIGADKVKLLHTNPEAFQDAELSEFLSDPDKYVRETFGAAA